MVRVLFQILKAQVQVLVPDSLEIEVELPGEDHPSHVLNEGCVKRDLRFEHAENVIDGVEACDWVQPHEVSDMLQGVRLKELKLGVLLKELPKLQKISWENVVAPKDVL